MNRLLNQDSDEEDHNMESTSSCGIAKSEVSHNLGKESNLFEDCIFAFHDSLQRVNFFQSWIFFKFIALKDFY